MAWVLTANLHDRVVAGPINETALRVQKMKDEQRELHASYPPGHELHRPLTGLTAGLRHAQVDRPFEVRVDRYSKPLPGFFGVGVSYAISGTARQAIEALEPDVHQFFPLDVTLPNGAKPHETFYLLNVCNRIDAVSIDDCENVGVRWPDKAQHPDNYYYACRISKLSGISVFQRKVEGLSIWFDWRIALLMMSDDLVNCFLERKFFQMEYEKPYFLHRIREV